MVNDGKENCNDGSDEEHDYADYGDDDIVDDDDDLAAIIRSDPTDLNMVDMPKSNMLKLKVIWQQRCQKPKS